MSRMLNGYRTIKVPECEWPLHSLISKTCSNWKGWAYEHRYIAEKTIGRKLAKTEIVHHLDCDKLNNASENLIVLVDRRSHLLLHAWIDSGKLVSESYSPNKNNHLFGVDKPKCIVCSKPTTTHENRLCSVKCVTVYRNQNKPPLTDLLTLLKTNSYVGVGKMYDVSDNAVRKWLTSYGYDPKTKEPFVSIE